MSCVNQPYCHSCFRLAIIVTFVGAVIFIGRWKQITVALCQVRAACVMFQGSTVTNLYDVLHTYALSDRLSHMCTHTFGYDTVNVRSLISEENEARNKNCASAKSLSLCRRIRNVAERDC